MTTNIAGIARAAMLVDLNIRTYSGRKQDKTTQAEVVANKGARASNAASVYKNLFSQCRELEDIIKFQAKVRTDHYRLTLPWADNGQRLLPTKTMMDYQAAMGTHKIEFDRLVQLFLAKYDTLVAAAAFQLGTLFDRNEYPGSATVAGRFNMDTNFTPLPTMGDFRLDIERQVQDELVAKYEARAMSQLAQANQDSWDRLHGVLTKLSDRLKVDEDGKKNKFHDTIVTNAEELCGLLTSLNVTGDKDLERARRNLQDALEGVTPQDLREFDITRVETKRKVDAILDQFDWGPVSNE